MQKKWVAPQDNPRIVKTNSLKLQLSALLVQVGVRYFQAHIHLERIQKRNINTNPSASG